MERQCRNPICGRMIPREAHHQQFYCSDSCRKSGPRNMQVAITTDDPMRTINQYGDAFQASFVRLAFRRRIEWRFFPGIATPLPLSMLPPLPGAGVYRIQYFDAAYRPMMVSEVLIHIPSQSISQYCNFTSGSRRATRSE